MAPASPARYYSLAQVIMSCSRRRFMLSFMNTYRSETVKGSQDFFGAEPIKSRQALRHHEFPGAREFATDRGANGFGIIELPVRAHFF